MNNKFDFFKDNSTKWYILGTIIAIEILVSESFLGYIHIEPISITFAYIPILIAGVLMGPAESTAVGVVFGLISMGKASASYVMAGDQVFSPLMSGHPVNSIILSVVMRALFGFISGFLYALAKKHSRHPDLWICIISFFGRTMHSALVYRCMALLFPELGYGVADVFQGFFSPSNLLSLLITAAIIWGCRCALRTRSYKRFVQRMSMVKNLRLTETYRNRPLAIFITTEFCIACAVTVYFVGRIRYMLVQKGIAVSDETVYDLVLLQAQFLIGILALMFLLTVFQVFNRRWHTCVEYEIRLDTLTGVWNRRSFFQRGESMLAEMNHQAACYGYFIMVDVDWFKQINDEFGHPEGDRVLHDIAKCLREIFSPIGLIGRLGGDEFAILIDKPVPRQQLEENLDQFARRIDTLSSEASSLTCSIGVLIISHPAPLEELYKKADRLLYLAKQQGRNRYIFSE